MADRDTGSSARDTVLFLSCWSTIGGAQVSLAVTLEALHQRFRAVLASPFDGPLMDRVRARELIAEHIPIPLLGSTAQVRTRLTTAVALARWLLRNRRRLRAVHANGDAELKLLLPVLPLIRTPIVVWFHSREISPSTLKLAPLWRLLGRRVIWAPVSEAAATQLARAGVDERRMAIVPNPIDPRDVVAEHEKAHDDPTTTLAYLGCEYESKGILLLPAIAEGIRDLPVKLLVVTKDWPEEQNSAAVNTALRRLRDLTGNVEFMRRDFDVRSIYARADALLVPSLSESFCRIAAEAMVVGLPVVASDLPAIREVTGDGAAALLFRAGDPAAAVSCIEELIADPGLWADLVERGQQRARAFDPALVVEKLVALYSR